MGSARPAELAEVAVRCGWWTPSFFLKLWDFCVRDGSEKGGPSVPTQPSPWSQGLLSLSPWSFCVSPPEPNVHVLVLSLVTLSFSPSVFYPFQQLEVPHQPCPVTFSWSVMAQPQAGLQRALSDSFPLLGVSLSCFSSCLDLHSGLFLYLT